MPTVHRFASFRVVIYTNDHRPAHVHVVETNQRDAVFNLKSSSGSVELREIRGKFSQSELNLIRDELDSIGTYLMEKWSEIHD